MRRKFLSAAIVAVAMSMAACGGDGEGESVAPEPGNGTQQPSDPKPEKTLMTFKASYDGGDNVSKTAISGTKDLVFSAGDEIKVYDGTQINSFTSDIETGTSATCNFTGLAFENKTYHAIYGDGKPYINEDYAEVSIPDKQTPVAGSFDPDAHVMVASADKDNKNFKFKTVNAFLRFTAPCDLKRVDVVASQIGGDIIIHPENGKYDNFSIDDSHSSVFSITMTGDMKAGNDYYISVAPGTYDEGITIKLFSADGKCAQYTTNPNLEIKPNTLRNFKKVADLPFNKILSRGLDDYLKSLTLADGEVATIELADYFVFVVAKALIYNSDKKVYLKLPNEVTEIHWGSFLVETEDGDANCPNLVKIDIPNSVTRIESWAFAGCEGLKELTIEGTPDLGQDVFYGCSPDLKVYVNMETYLKYGDEGKEYHGIMVDPRIDAGASASVETAEDGDPIK